MGVGNTIHQLLYPPQERYLMPLYRRLGGPAEPVWTDAESLAATGVRSLDCSSPY